MKYLHSSKTWLLVLALALAAALVTTNRLPVLNAALMPVFAGLLLLYRQLLKQETLSLQMMVWFALIAFGLFLGIYKPFGFSYPQVFSVSELHQTGKAFSLHINTSKMLAGYVTLFLLLPLVKAPGKVHIHSQAGQLFTAIFFAATVLLLACLILNLDFYPKPVRYVLSFGVINLFVTCVSEEAFMRLIFQTQLILLVSKYTDKILLNKGIPLIVTTTLFVATHSLTSVEMIVVYALAGASYSLVFTLTNNVFASIATQFLVNFVHFSLLTYPL